MAQTYGKSTNSVIDRALTIKSVFAPYFGDNGYKFNGDNAITVLSFDNGTLSGYNEGSLKPAPITLVGTTGNDYTLGYNQAMFARIQKHYYKIHQSLTVWLNGHANKLRKYLFQSTTFTQSVKLWLVVRLDRYLVSTWLTTVYQTQTVYPLLFLRH